MAAVCGASCYANQSVDDKLTDLPLTEPVTKTVRRNDVEHLPRDTVVLFDVELGEFLSVGLRRH